MSIVELCTGNMFNDDFVEAFGHGVNIRGSAGAGIILQIKEKYPEAIKQYKTACKKKLFDVGKIQIVKCDDANHKSKYRYIINMATQDDPGAHAKLSWVKQCVQKLVNNEDKLPFKSLALPKIGAGIGGLSWTDVQPEICKLFKNSDLIVRLYE